MEKINAVNKTEEGDSEFDNLVDHSKTLAGELGMSLLELAKEKKKSRESDFESTQEHIEAYKKKIEQLRNDIDELKKNIISRILDYKKITELRKELSRDESFVANEEETQQWRIKMIKYYDDIISQEDKLGQLMDEAYKDNANFDAKKKTEFLEDENNRSVETLAKKHQVFFVHDIIDADWKPSANNHAINTRNLDFDDQLNIVLGLDPTLPVSTLSPNSKNRTFGNGAWGVLLGGGRIVGGEDSDAATTATSLTSRWIKQSSRSIEAIDDAIKRPRVGGKINGSSYNELVMERPEVAGVYFKWSSNLQKLENGVDVFLQKKDQRNHGRGDAWWDHLGGVMKTGAPLFVIEADNNVRMVYDINLKNRSFKVTPKYDPENMANMPGVYKQHTDHSFKKAAMSKVFDKVANIIPKEKRKAFEQSDDRGNNDLYVNVH